MTELRTIMHVRVGNDTFPASQADIIEIQNQITEVLKSDGYLTLVTHHAFEVEEVKVPPHNQGFFVVKVGNDMFPAAPEDIEDAQNILVGIQGIEILESH